jgi:hypothetical protein
VQLGVQQKLVRHSNVVTTMNEHGNATLRAERQANSRVVEMVMSQQEQPQSGGQKTVA